MYVPLKISRNICGLKTHPSLNADESRAEKENDSSCDLLLQQRYSMELPCFQLPDKVSIAFKLLVIDFIVPNKVLTGLSPI